MVATAKGAPRLHRFGVGLLWAVAALTTLPAAAQQDWQPEKTWLLAVGVLEWKDGKDWPAMESAKEDRRDVQLVEHFKSGSVLESHIAYL